MIFINDKEIIMTERWYIYNRQLVLLDKIIPFDYDIVRWETLKDLKRQLDEHPNYIQIN